MSWESATAVVYEPEPTLEQVRALEEFLDSHIRELLTCCAPEKTALRPTFAKFITKLFKLDATALPKNSTIIEKHLNGVVSKACSILSREELFKHLITHALEEHDVLLLQVVYSLLFTQIKFNSEITMFWFSKRIDSREGMSEPSDLAYALEVLTTVEFLNLRQNWVDTKPTQVLLESINTNVRKSKDDFLTLSWGLALFILANQLHRIDITSEDFVDIEPLIIGDQSNAGHPHWSSLLLDQISASLPGLGTLMEAYAIIDTVELEIASKVRLAQTVADVIGRLAPITEPSIELIKALALTVRNHEGLKSEQWLPDQAYTSVFAGMPYTSTEMVYIAQTLSYSARISSLKNLHSYFCEVDASCLDLPNNAKQPDSSFLQKDVRSNQVVTVLQARPTDHQGAIELEPHTRGTLISFEKTLCLVGWYFDYNGWSLLGRMLENQAFAEDVSWSSYTRELLRLITMSSGSIDVLNSISSGLERGDIVDFVESSLQKWLQCVHNTTNSDANKFKENIQISIDFLVNYAQHNRERIWVFMKYIDWYDCGQVCIKASKRILNILLEGSGTGVESSLKRSVIDKYALLFASQYAAMEHFDNSVLDVISLLLPYSEMLQQSFLSSSELREGSISPLLNNLNSFRVLEFCSLCLGMISSDSRYTHSVNDEGLHLQHRLKNKFVNRRQTHLERKLFEMTGILVSLFLTRTELRQLILNIWTVLIENPDSPSLLAFLDEKEIGKLQKELISILCNMLEPVETIGDLSAFLASSRHQEGLLDMLRSEVMPYIENRSQIELRPGCLADMNTLRAVFDALKLSRKGLKTETIEKIETVISMDLDMACLADQIALKVSAIELLGSQMKIDPERLVDFSQQIGTLTSKLTVINATGSENLGGSNIKDLIKQKTPLNPDASQSARHMSQLLRVWCEFLVIASDKSTVSRARKSDWSRRLLVANNFESISDVLLYKTVQKGEESRFETVLYILSRNCTATFELAKILRDKISEVMDLGSIGLECSRAILLALMKSMARVLSRIEEFGEKIDDISNQEVCKIVEGVFNIALIKQIQLGINERLLNSQIMIFDMSMLLLERFTQDESSHNTTNLQHVLQRAIVESACDRSIVYSFGEASVEEPHFGELLLMFIHRILPLNEYTAISFVKNGLINVLIDSPLCRCIQDGGITQYRCPSLHSLWRNGILPTLNLLLKSLGIRVASQVWMLFDAYSAQALTCLDQWKAGYITLELIEETVLLFAVCYHTEQFAPRPEGFFDVEVNRVETLKIVKFLLAHQNYLSERLVRRQQLHAVVEALEDFEAILEN